MKGAVTEDELLRLRAELGIREQVPGLSVHRELESPDPEAIAWGRAHLNRTAWARAARLRGLPAPERALARRLARAP